MSNTCYEGRGKEQSLTSKQYLSNGHGDSCRLTRREVLAGIFVFVSFQRGLGVLFGKRAQHWIHRTPRVGLGKYCVFRVRGSLKRKCCFIPLCWEFQGSGAPQQSQNKHLILVGRNDACV